MSIIVITTPVIVNPPPPPPSGPKSAEGDVVYVGNSRVEFQNGRPSFADLCRAVIDLFRAWRS